MNSGTSTCDYARGYEVYVSSDGASWGAPVAAGSASASPVTVTFPTQTRQYFKVVQTGTSGCWWTIAELKVFASAWPLEPLGLGRLRVAAQHVLSAVADVGWQR